MTTYLEVIVEQGTDFNKTITIRDILTNAYQNLVGHSVSSSFRKSYTSANVSGQFLCTIFDGANGKINISMTSANTANIDSGRYVFDVKDINTANLTSRIVEGIIILTPQVT